MSRPARDAGHVWTRGMICLTIVGLAGLRVAGQETTPADGPTELLAASPPQEGGDKPRRSLGGGLMEPPPAEIAGLDVIEHLGEHLPLDLQFTDEDGRPVTLRHFFNGQRPVILNLGYYRCPMLCGLILNGLTDGMKKMDWTPGQQFEIVSVSFNPQETPALARLKKQNYLKEYGRPSAGAGWHFLTGDEKNITALTEAVGFPYRWNDARQEFSHPSVLVVISPNGKITRYLYGILFRSTTLRLALLEASEGKVGTTTDRFLLWCFHYDANEGKYALAAGRVMAASGILVVLVLAAWAVPHWVRDGRVTRENGPDEGTAGRSGNEHASGT